MECPTDRFFMIFTSAERRPVSNLHRCVQRRYWDTWAPSGVMRRGPNTNIKLGKGFESLTRPLQLQSAPLLATQLHGCFHMVTTVRRREGYVSYKVFTSSFFYWCVFLWEAVQNIKGHRGLINTYKDSQWCPLPENMWPLKNVFKIIWNMYWFFKKNILPPRNTNRSVD